MSTPTQPPPPPTGETKKEKTEKTEDKIDIVAETENEDAHNFALPLPGTQSTYNRVEKGTRTALVYWDGWLTAEDAKAADEDASYYQKTKKQEPPKRNTNLKKNWTYGERGEIIYIATGFVGCFDNVKESNIKSAYLNPKSASGGGNKNINVYQKSIYGASALGGLAGNKTLKNAQTGPVVGTHFDLMGNPKDRSAYANLTSTHAHLGGNTNDDYFAKSGAGKSSGSLKKNWQYGKNGEIIYIPTGFVGMFDKAKPGNKSSYGTVSPGANKSSYGTVGGGNKSAYGAAPGGGGTGSSYGKVGGGADASNNGYDPTKKNWTYGPNKEIVYIPTGFVGMFDKGKPGKSASGTSVSTNRSSYGTVGGGGGAANKSSYGNVGGGGGGGASSPSVGTQWDLKRKSNTRSHYANLK